MYEHPMKTNKLYFLLSFFLSNQTPGQHVNVSFYFSKYILTETDVNPNMIKYCTNSVDVNLVVHMLVLGLNYSLLY